MSDSLSEKIKHELRPNFSFLIYWLKMVCFVLTIWLGISSSSFLLLAQAVILVEPISQLLFRQKNQLHTFKAYTAVIQISLAIFISTIFLFGILKLTNTLGVLIVSVIVLIINLIIALRFEGKKFSLQILKDNTIWLVILIVSIIILSTGYLTLDLGVGFGLIAYLLTQSVFKIRDLFSGEKPAINVQKQPLTKISELSENIETKLLSLDNVCNLHDFEVIDTDNVLNVVGHIVVQNTTTQGQIFETKDQVKAILKKEGLENSTIEFEYKVEFEDLVKKENS